MTKDEVIMRIYSKIPSANLIVDLDTTKEDQIRFTWRGSRFKVGLNLFVEKVDGNLLFSDNEACLMRNCLGVEGL